MAITHFGNKMIRGTKIDRVVDSLGSSADGTNSGITLIETLNTGVAIPTNAGWSSNTTDISTSSSGVAFSFDSSSIDETVYYDLQNSSVLNGSNTNDTKWTLRGKIAFSNNTANGTSAQAFDLRIALCADTSYSGETPSQENIGLAIGNRSGNTNYLITHAMNSGASDQSVSNTNSISNGANTYYFQLEKQSTTTLQLKVFSDSSFSTQLGTTLTDTFSNITALRYLHVSGFSQSVGGSGNMTGVISELKIHDNSTDGDAKLGTGAYSFDGSGDQVIFGSASDWAFLNSGEDFSLAFWCKPTATNANQQLFATMNDSSGSNKGFAVSITSANKMNIAVYPSAGGGYPFANDVGTSVFEAGVWHHYALVYTKSDGKMRIYKDGSVIITQSKGGTFTAGTPQFALMSGQRGDGGDRDYDGKLDDVGVYSRALTATEIGKLANNNESASAGWTLNNSAIADGKITCTGSGESYKSFTGLGKPTDFTLDFDFTRNSGDGGDTSAILLASDNGGYGDPSSGHIRLHFYIANGNSTQLSFRMNSGSGNVETNFSLTGGAQSTGTTKYYRIVKDDATITCYKYPTANDRTNGTNLDTSANGTVNTTTYNAVSNDFQYFIVDGHGSATKNFAVDNVKYYKDKTSPSGTPEINETFTQGDAQLVSSLSDKSGLKAHYTMDSTRVTDASGTDTTIFSTGTGWSGDTSTWAYNSTINGIGCDTSTVGEGVVKDFGTQLSNSGKWMARFKLTRNSGDQGDGFMVAFGTKVTAQLNPTTSLLTRLQNDDYPYGLHVYIANGGTLYFAAHQTNQGTWDGSSGGSGKTLSAGSSVYVELQHHSATSSTCKFFDNSDYSDTPTIQTRTFSNQSQPYDEIGLGTKWSSNNKNVDLEDFEVWIGIDSLDGCKNDFSSTSDLQAMTNLPENTLFLQTDDSPSYWWKQSDNTWKLDGGSEINVPMTASSWTFQGNQGSAHTHSIDSGVKWISQYANNKTGAGVAVGTIGATLGSKWVARYNWTGTGSYTEGGNGYVIIGLSTNDTYGSSDTTNTQGGDSAQVQWHIGNNSGDRHYRVRGWNGGSNVDGNTTGGNTVPWVAETQYFELSYDGTTLKHQRYTDSTYSTAHSVVTPTKDISGITGLTHIIFGSNDTGHSHGGFTLILNEFKIQKGFSEWQ